MTFEEFRDSALNPIYPENKCIYCLEVLTVKNPLTEIFEKSKFDVEIRQRIFYLDKEAAVMKVKMLGAEKSHLTPIFAIYLYELPINKDVSNNQFQRVWSYDRFGNMIDHSYSTEVIEDIDHSSAKYRGREKDSIRFKPGEIVEIYDRENEAIVRGIVAETPLTIEECWKKLKQVEKKCEIKGLSADNANTKYWLHAIDDCYTVLLPFGCPSTLRSWDVFPISAPLPLRQREKLYKSYQEYISKKVKKDDYGNCSFQELLDML